MNTKGQNKNNEESSDLFGSVLTATSLLVAILGIVFLVATVTPADILTMGLILLVLRLF